MYRYLTILLLPLALLFVSPAPSDAQWGGYPPNYQSNWRDGLEGVYVNYSNGGTCYVYQRRNGYLFVNENGSRARFVYTGPGRLRMASGEWDPNIVASVSQDARGRTVIRFDAPYTPTGYWISGY